MKMSLILLESVASTVLSLCDQLNQHFQTVFLSDQK